MYRLVNDGTLRAYRIGRSICVDTRDLNAYLRDAETGGAA